MNLEKLLDHVADAVIAWDESFFQVYFARHHDKSERSFEMLYDQRWY